MGRGDSGEGVSKGFNREGLKRFSGEGQRDSGTGFGVLVRWTQLYSTSSSLTCVRPPCQDGFPAQHSSCCRWTSWSAARASACASGTGGGRPASYATSALHSPCGCYRNREYIHKQVGLGSNESRTQAFSNWGRRRPGTHCLHMHVIKVEIIA